MTGWSEERTELARKLWNEGKSAAEIASVLGGTTRNSVIGKVHRLGLHKRTGSSSQGARPVGQRTVSQRVRKKSLNKPFYFGAPSPKEPRPSTRRPSPGAEAPPIPHPYVPIEPVPVSERVRLLDLKRGDCRFPSGDPREPDFGFCGQPVMEGVSYCEYHQSVTRIGIPTRSVSWPSRR